jgi:hypothetical protein
MEQAGKREVGRGVFSRPVPSSHRPIAAIRADARGTGTMGRSRIVTILGGRVGCRRPVSASASATPGSRYACRHARDLHLRFAAHGKWSITVIVDGEALLLAVAKKRWWL